MIYLYLPINIWSLFRYTNKISKQKVSANKISTLNILLTDMYLPIAIWSLSRYNFITFPLFNTLTTWLNFSLYLAFFPLYFQSYLTIEMTKYLHELKIIQIPMGMSWLTVGTWPSGQGSVPSYLDKLPISIWIKITWE